MRGRGGWGRDLVVGGGEGDGREGEGSGAAKFVCQDVLRDHSTS